MDQSDVDHLLSQSLKPATILAVSAIIFATVKLASAYLRLRHIPGPFLAALTNFVRRSWVLAGDLHQKHTDLHSHYGTVSEFYDSIIPRIKGGKIPDVFGTRDEDMHRKMRRPIANLYSIANLTNFEPLVLSTMQRFFTRLDELFTDEAEELDLCQWLQFFTFDVMGEVTFSRRLGFLEEGADVEEIMANNWKYFQMAAPMPWLDHFWKDNPLLPAVSKRNPLADFGAARIKERLSMTDEERDHINQSDFLSSFIKEKQKDPDLPEMTLPTWTNSNIQAGGDTTAIMASVVFYHLLKNPTTLAKIQQEIDDAANQGHISELVTWKQSQTLPYLDACVKEASRLHPPIGFPLERIVPESGLEVDGYRIPPGTRVSMNPWAVHREVGLYGTDPDVWRPERWMCDREKKKVMYNSLLTLELVDPNAQWSLETKWFTMPSGFRIRIRSRKVKK
ncbi:MAG: hypothetical protein Q9172_004954 [Xanthocarpia lactea]